MRIIRKHAALLFVIAAVLGFSRTADAGEFTDEVPPYAGMNVFDANPVIIDDLKAEDINISAAKSRIWDADMSAEITEFTRLQILQQSGTAILAQANAQPQSILQLLR